jgi:hypothetical protein
MFRVTESFALHTPKIEEANVTRVTEALMPGGGSYALEINLEAIHEGLTRNYTHYSKEGLTHTERDDQGNPGGLESWLKPHPAPVIKNHDGSNVDNIIGRMTKAEWVEKSGKTPGHLALTAEITEPDAIAKFLRGEYQTGSVGLDVDTAKCSICDEDLQAAGWGGLFHEHQRGKFYKKGEKGTDYEGRFVEVPKTEAGAKLAKVMVGNCYGREYSMVVTPSDAKSRVTSMEVKEVKLKGKKAEADAEESISLWSRPTLTESVTDPVVDPVDPPAEPVDRSVAEILNEHFGIMRNHISANPVSVYYNLLKTQEDAVYTGEVMGYFGVKTVGEVKKLAEYVFVNNPDHEDELNEVAYCVLSTENNSALPDTAFALVLENADGKKIRRFPYRNAEGQIDPTALRTSLTWVVLGPAVGGKTENQDAGVRARRILRAAAIKHQASTQEPEEAQIEAAKTLLTSKGFLVKTAAESSTLEAELKAKIENLEGEIGTLTREALDRDAEFDTLTVQVQDLGTELEAAQATTKATVVEAILTVQGLDEATRSAKMDELLALETADLQTQLTEATTEASQIFASARVGKSGLGLENELTETTPDNLADDGGTILAAFLGSKSAQKKVSRGVSELVKHLPK